MDDVRFDFGTSFIRFGAEREIKLLGRLVKAHSEAPLTIFGHADPTGTDDYNKRLSGRRASAVYGLLTRDTAIWEHLYSEGYGDDHWGLQSIQTMLKALDISPGEIDGVDGPKTQEAVRQFQSSNGLPQTGQPSLSTRTKLFRAYMDFLCGADFRLTKSDFLSGGADSKGKGDYQGCGEFNAVVRASQEQELEFSDPDNTAARNEFNSANRRVTIFLFRPGTHVAPNLWPCPNVLEGTGKCRQRFWADSDQRQKAGAAPREFEKTFDTFACRFYQRIAGESPCERRTRRKLLRIFVQDERGKAIPNEKYTLEVNGVLVSTETDTTDGRGMLQKIIPFEATTGVLSVRTHNWDLQIADPPPHSEEAGVRARLANLGFLSDAESPDADKLAFSLVDFQTDSNIDRTGTIDAPTTTQLDKIHQLS
jgi:hypothetical protein